MFPYTVSKAAALLGVHPNTLRRWEREGKIAAARTPGGHRRYSIEEINRLRTSMGLRPLGNSEALHAQQRIRLQ